MSPLTYSALPRPGFADFAHSFPGQLAIGLDQNLDINVPNNVLVVPDTYVAPSGQVTTNNSALALLLAPTKGVNVNDIPILGRPFFSSAYLMVDLEAMTFTLWQANATTDSRLVTVGGTCASSPQVNQTPEPTITSSASPTATLQPDGKLSTGAIVGIVVGGACALVIVAGFIAFTIVRKKRLSLIPSDDNRPSLNVFDSPQTLQQSGYRASETHYYPQEMLAGQDQLWELLTHERPGEAPGGPWDSRPIELPSVRESKHQT